MSDITHAVERWLAAVTYAFERLNARLYDAPWEPRSGPACRSC